MYGQVCAAALPDFSRSPSVLAGMPFQLNTSFGTYYHRNLNLSVKISERGGQRNCSMVFASKDDPTQIAIVFGTAVSAATGTNTVGVDPSAGISRADLGNGALFEIRPAAPSGSDRYYRALIVAPK